MSRRMTRCLLALALACLAYAGARTLAAPRARGRAGPDHGHGGAENFRGVPKVFTHPGGR
jgi:hypothetical protein